MLRYKLSTCFYLALALTLCAHLTWAQNVGSSQPAIATQQETELLKALLDEVRQLRLAVQHASLSHHRALILMEQSGRQRAVIESLSAELEQLKARIQADADPRRFDEEIKEMETAMSEAEPQLRFQLSQTYASLKRSIERQKKQAEQELESRKERAQQLESKLRLEQAKLAEIQEQMDALERELSQQVAATRR